MSASLKTRTRRRGGRRTGRSSEPPHPTVRHLPVARGAPWVRPDLVVLAGDAARRRRRVVAGVLVVAVAMFLLGTVVGAHGAPASDGPPAALETVTVAPGGTLWDIATTHAPAGTDPRSYLGEIRRLNGLHGEVEAWTVVVLPPP